MEPIEQQQIEGTILQAHHVGAGVVWFPDHGEERKELHEEGVIVRWHGRGVFVRFKQNVALCKPENLKWL